jgi:hydroxyquinol 1,2-dioxygenase
MENWNLADEELTAAVRASFQSADSERTRELLDALVRHLHCFVRETGVTEQEWLAGIEFLTRAGHITDDRRQEFVLLSDILGISMLVIGMNNRKPPNATESTVFGPFFVPGSPLYENGDDLGNGAPGTPCVVRGRVSSTDGEPIAGARVDVWQADEDGKYDVQYTDLAEPRGRGHVFSASDGRFWFRTIRPEAYPIPTDGPAGDLLRAGGRGAMRPAHIHFRIEAEGFQTLITHVFAAGDPYLGSDAVFGVKRSLVAPFTESEHEGWAVAELHFEFVLVPV